MIQLSAKLCAKVIFKLFIINAFTQKTGKRFVFNFLMTQQSNSNYFDLFLRQQPLLLLRHNRLVFAFYKEDF